MKFGLTLFFIFLSQVSLAQSLKERSLKNEMLERVDTLIQRIDESRKALDQEDVVTACTKINDMFRLLPDHLVSIGTRMDLFDPKVINMEHESKMFLMFMHQQSNICANGEIGENLDIGKTSKKLKSIKKSLKKQRKRISKSDTNYNNSYNYYYEFNGDVSY